MKGKHIPASPVHIHKPEEEFVKEYNALCEKRGYRITAILLWKLRDDGSYSTIIQYGVEKIIQENK